MPKEVNEFLSNIVSFKRPKVKVFPNNYKINGFIKPTKMWLLGTETAVLWNLFE